MGEAIADLLQVSDTAIVSGGDWPQFNAQIVNFLQDQLTPICPSSG
jgi:hypothetical protein